eukprot:TRINITY_DN1570_c0_g1_i1.p1 TRINITY_DN1570_c0_g1~~TRINITY_DN1570_c0_g1_i1.p1  ORF type:complete len:100 (+),score=10.82 TRINITY_DN1570_c0_g1_i1:107-406(+)
MEPISKEDRVRGAFLGLAAGVRNGGPMRMAMRLAESLLDKRQLDMNDVVKRYHDWFGGLLAKLIFPGFVALLLIPKKPSIQGQPLLQRSELSRKVILII